MNRRKFIAALAAAPVAAKAAPKFPTYSIRNVRVMTVGELENQLLCLRLHKAGYLSYQALLEKLRPQMAEAWNAFSCEISEGGE